VKPRDILHLLLGIPALAGLVLALVFFSSSSRSDVSEAPYGAHVVAAWSAIFAELPAPMPYVAEEETEAEEDLAGIDNIELLNEEQRRTFARNNAFVSSCAVLALLGIAGVALIGAATTRGESRTHPFFRAGAMTGVALGGTLLGGFHLAYPGVDSSWFALPAFRLPGQLDSLAYGLGGVTEWTDLFFLSVYAAFVGVALLGPCSARMTATCAFLLAIPIATFCFPLAVSWKWGGGWLDSLRNNYDFAGAALVHWHVGVVVLLASGLAALFRRTGGDETDPAAPGKVSWPLFAPGIVLYLALMVGLNAGSTLAATPEWVAAVLQATAIAGAAALPPALAWWALARTRSLTEHLGFGLLAGAVSVSGAADAVTAEGALALGVVAGLLASGAMVAIDHMGWPDPTAVGPVHGIGGLVAVLGAAFVDPEVAHSSLVGQLTLLASVPLVSLVVAAVVVPLAGLSKVLFADSATSAASGRNP